MASIFKRKAEAKEELIRQLESIQVLDDKTSPIVEYSETTAKARKSSIITMIAIVLVEIGIAGVFFALIETNNFQTRVSRELEIERTGKIDLSSGEYAGETDFGYFFGQGSFSFDTGAFYDGGWENNKLEGLGELKVPVEGTYSGEFDDSLKSGNGKFTWDDGDVYDGEWKNDQMNGQGEYKTSDDVIYSGTFKDNGFYEGTCVFSNTTGDYNVTYKDGAPYNAKISYKDGSSYDGGLVEGNLSGTGTMKLANGESYVGDFKDGKREGNGKYNWESGASYDGAWAGDQMSGTGTYSYADESYASGTFDKNEFISGSYYLKNDFGAYTFTITDKEPTAVKMELEGGTVYEGDISDGELTGQANIKYSNGDTYSGNVTNGQKTKTGIYTWAGGASYDGSWVDDQMQGNGTYMYSKNEEGYKLVGKFENGKPTGQCEYYTNASTHYKTDWSNGKCVKIYE